jgi:hypothetical protein
MENYHSNGNGNGYSENGHSVRNHAPPFQPPLKLSLPCLDIRVFYVRVSKCDIDDSTPHHLALNHIPLNHETLLEVNGSRIGINSDGVLTNLKRDRLDKRSEEVTFVSTDSIRMSGSVKFEVFDKDVLVLSGVLDLCHSNGNVNGEFENHNGQKWVMNCESNLLAGVGFLKGSHELETPEIEVYVAGAFAGNPIILTKTLQLGFKRKQSRVSTLESIPEYEAAELQKEEAYRRGFEELDHRNYKPEYEDYQISNYDYNNSRMDNMDYYEGEDGELSWFNAGVRVGVGIGLSICLGVGIGVGLLVRTYQGTTRNFRRRLI